MRVITIIFICKILSAIIKLLRLGEGSTWPGHVALHFSPHFIKDTIKQNNFTTIVIAGTNGKTTTSKVLRTILEASKKEVIHNESGANLLNGIASALIAQLSVFPGERWKKRYAIFEADENTLPKLIEEVTPDYLVLLNLFRDQLDRYGEVRTIASRWQHSLMNLSPSTSLIINGDDPQLAFLGEGRKNTHFFGLTDSPKQTTREHATDSTYCPRCNTKLAYKTISFSHLGNWSCPKCGLKRPRLVDLTIPPLPLLGTYNKYNAAAALLTANLIGIDTRIAKNSLGTITPAFGRQERFTFGKKKIQILLSKNPAGMNESLRTIKSMGAKYILFLLNDQIADGQDVSWIWDVDFESLLPKKAVLFTSGTRAFDIALRLKYTNPNVKHVDTYPNLTQERFQQIFSTVPDNNTLYIIPTYTAMLHARKIITGKEIL